MIYYSLLHPKSTDIWQDFVRKSCGFAGGDRAERESSPQRTALAEDRPESPGTSQEEGYELTSLGEPPSSQWGPPESGLESQISGGDSFLSHHHWLLVKLALKTGNVSKINAAFGEDGPGYFCAPAWGLSQHYNQQRKPPFSQQALPSSPHGSLTSENGSDFRGVSKAEADQSETSSYVSFTSDNYHKAPVQQPAALQQRGGPEEGAGAVSRERERGAGGQLSGAGGQGSATLYFSAISDGATPAHHGGGPAPAQTWGRGSPAQPAAPPPAAKPFPATIANISPVLGTGPGRRLRPSTVVPSRSPAGSDGGERTRDPNHPATAGPWMSLPQVGPRPAEEPCLTSTPKSESIHRDGSPEGRPETEARVTI